MAYFATDLSREAFTYRAGRARHQAWCAGAKPHEIDGIARLLWRLFRRRRRAAGLCVECGSTLDGHRCPPTGD